MESTTPSSTSDTVANATQTIARGLVDLPRPSESVTFPQGVMSSQAFYGAYTAIVCVAETVNAFGVLSNILNIIVYCRLGFAKSTNISLLALAASDLGSVVCATWAILMATPGFERNAWSPDVVHLTGGWLNVALTRCTACLTAFISLERCLCVAWPLKIRRVITPRRTGAAMVTIFAIILLLYAMVHLSNRLAWSFDVARNRTLLGSVVAGGRAERTAYVVSQVMYSLVLPVATFVIVGACTIFLIASLHRSAAWRSEHAQSISTRKRLASIRERRAVKVALSIAIVFIISSLPMSATILATVVIPGFGMRGRYLRLMVTTSATSMLSSSVNASANIFIYYTSSSKFRQAFLKLFTTSSKRG